MMLIKEKIFKAFDFWASLFTETRARLGAKFYLILLFMFVAASLELVGLYLFIPLIESLTGSGAQSSIGGAFIDLSAVLRGLLKPFGIESGSSAILLFMAAIFSVKGLFLYAQGIFTERTILEVEARTRQNLLRGICQAELAEIDRKETGVLVNTISNAVVGYGGTFRRLIGLLVSFAFVLFYLSGAALLNPILVGSALAVSLAVFIWFRRFSSRLKRLSIDLTRGYESLNSELIRFFNGLEYLLATGMEKVAELRLRKYIGFIAKRQLQISRINIAVNTGIEPVAIVGISIFLIVGMEGGSSNVGSSLVSLMILYKAFTRLMTLQVEFQKIHSGFGNFSAAISLRRWVEISRNHSRGQKSEAKVLTYSLKVKNLGVTKDGVKILDSVSFESSGLSSLALAGETGSGKTTLIKVLMGLMPISNGSVLIDSTPIHLVDLGELSKRIGYVPQKPLILDGTVMDNLTLWDTIADGQCAQVQHRALEILESLRLKEAVGKIGGLKARVGEGGVRLSGGQEQRLALARELLKKPMVLILDEPTSALDSETEVAVLDVLSNLMSDTKVVLVSHRPEVLELCDQILNLKRGRLISVVQKKKDS
jgi:ABC-type multidrug transport system fused ATPase/permease subunit